MHRSSTPNRDLEVTIYTTNSFDALDLAHQRGRVRDTARTRRALAASLRSAANRLDPAPLAPRPASQS